MLEVGRVLASEPTPPNDVILLFTDGEEPTPRFGAWGFAEYHPWFADVALAVNLDGIGVSGPTMLVEMSGPKEELILRLANAAPDLVAFSFMTQTADLIGGPVSDFDVFRDAGVPGYNFTYMRGVSIYHSSRDAIDVANANGLAHDISLSLGIARGTSDPSRSGTRRPTSSSSPPRSASPSAVRRPGRSSVSLPLCWSSSARCGAV